MILVLPIGWYEAEDPETGEFIIIRMMDVQHGISPDDLLFKYIHLVNKEKLREREREREFQFQKSVKSSVKCYYNYSN